jgi:hypothetical protein
MFDGIQREKDPFFDKLQQSVFDELSKYADPEPEISDSGIKHVSVEDAMKELLDLKNGKKII